MSSSAGSAGKHPREDTIAKWARSKDYDGLESFRTIFERSDGYVPAKILRARAAAASTSTGRKPNIDESMNSPMFESLEEVPDVIW